MTRLSHGKLSHMAQTIPPSTSPDSPRGPVTGTAATPRKRRKFFLLDLYGTAVGKKYVMAITGIIGIGYVVAHMVGNLKMFLGKDRTGLPIDHYGEFLRELLVPILPRTVTLWLHAARCSSARSSCTSTPRTR